MKRYQPTIHISLTFFSGNPFFGNLLVSARPITGGIVSLASPSCTPAPSYSTILHLITPNISKTRSGNNAIRPHLHFTIRANVRMSSQTFHRFLDLPRELQIQIWTQAAGNLTLTTNYFWNASIPVRLFIMIRLHYWYLYNGTPHEGTPYERAVVRWRRMMMGACQLSRQIALEVLRKEISDVPLGQTRLIEAPYGTTAPPMQMQWQWQRWRLQGVDKLLGRLEVRR